MGRHFIIHTSNSEKKEKGISCLTRETLKSSEVVTSAKKNDPEKSTTEHVLSQALPVSFEFIFPFSHLVKLLTSIRCKGRSEGKVTMVLVGTTKIIELSVFDTNMFCYLCCYSFP